MNKYSPFYHDPKYKHDVTKLSDQALEERIIFLNILSKDPNISTSTRIDINPYLTAYDNEWERRRLETNHNHN